MLLHQRLSALQERLPAGVILVAVSKTHPAEIVREAYDAGQRIFGESRPLELKAKYDLLPKDIEWHFIGTLQTKQVKYYAPFVSLIHSVDSEKALQVIQKEAEKNNRTIDVLMEVHIAEEEAKQGWGAEELEAYLASGRLAELKNLRLRGLMGMATYTDDTMQIKREFTALHQLFESLKTRYAIEFGGVFDTLSMGMSGDWAEAIECGSTMVRVGSYLFGNRS